MRFNGFQRVARFAKHSRGQRQSMPATLLSIHAVQGHKRVALSLFAELSERQRRPIERQRRPNTSLTLQSLHAVQGVELVPCKSLPAVQCPKLKTSNAFTFYKLVRPSLAKPSLQMLTTCLERVFQNIPHSPNAVLHPQKNPRCGKHKNFLFL